MDELLQLIISKKSLVGIIGLGYVGSEFSQIVAKNNFQVIGYDFSKLKTSNINKQNIPNLSAQTDMSSLTKCDIVIVCVQTPIDENKNPDLSFVKNAIETIMAFHSKKQLIILESSVATGTTRQVVLPLLEETGLTLGEDFFLAFSPERIDPGNKTYPVDEIPKIVSGVDEPSLELITAFYKQIFKQVVPVSSPETAEMVKLFENTFRLINISLVNELTEYTKSWGINLWEVINAAATKPFGFLAHYPGPGIGGHCIPVDPFYLFDDARKRGIQLRLIEAAGVINDLQPQKVVKSAYEIVEPTFIPALSFSELSQQNKISSIPIGQKGGKSQTKKRNVLLIGLAYKPDIDDMRESSSLKVWELFENDGWGVSYHDPYIPLFREKESQELSEDVLSKQDLIIILTNHTSIDYQKLASYGKPILDTRHVFTENSYPHIHYL